MTRTATGTGKAGGARRLLYAFCPQDGCGKRLPVDPAPPKRVPDHAAPKFPVHRHPVGGNCASSTALVLLRHREHLCVVCRALPVAEPGTVSMHLVGVHTRPPEPRPIDKRSPAGNPHCTSHWRDVLERRRAAASASRRRSVHGIPDELFELVLAAQGGACVCGKPFRKGYTPRVDHDHDHAREHCDHDPKVACPACFRGLLHDACNQVLVGRFTIEQLINVARYKVSPTTDRLAGLDERGRPDDPRLAVGWRQLVQARGDRE